MLFCSPHRLRSTFGLKKSVCFYEHWVTTAEYTPPDQQFIGNAELVSDGVHRLSKVHRIVSHRNGYRAARLQDHARQWRVHGEAPQGHEEPTFQINLSKDGMPLSFQLGSSCCERMFCKPKKAHLKLSLLSRLSVSSPNSSVNSLWSASRRACSNLCLKSSKLEAFLYTE